ncbi:MAG: VTT domain-containing protein, partial [Actinomycetota bacterium]|nr:VTT domain-containing protein [Actinomycetota bacterium]
MARGEGPGLSPGSADRDLVAGWHHRPVASWRRLLVFALALVAFFLLGFLLVEALDVPLLSDPSPWLDRPGVAAALLGTGLLVADVVAPVPSSVVMVAHGALFGVLAGSLLSLVGRVGAALVGFAIGRRGGAVVAPEMASGAVPAKAHWALERWGAVAVVLSRPVPVLAETVVVLAGASGLSWRAVVLASIVGSAPE